jgi:ABC-type Mn2+/Zn2+ transport system ATPase subunit
VVAMGLYAKIGWLKRIEENHWRDIKNALILVGMEEYADKPIGELSGGQQQRVMIGRALVANPELLILDEPTAAVDITAQTVILETLEKINKKQGITVLMVSHDINEIVHFCDKVALLNKRLIGFGRPGEILNKENLRSVYGDRLLVYDHRGHPHILVGDFDE